MEVLSTILLIYIVLAFFTGFFLLVQDKIVGTKSDLGKIIGYSIVWFYYWFFAKN